MSGRGAHVASAAHAQAPLRRPLRRAYFHHTNQPAGLFLAVPGRLVPTLLDHLRPKLSEETHAQLVRYQVRSELAEHARCAARCRRMD
eukprot:scaffold10408_cov26-Tisochrysis_lutea.AAC.2